MSLLIISICLCVIFAKKSVNELFGFSKIYHKKRSGEYYYRLEGIYKNNILYSLEFAKHDYEKNQGYLKDIILKKFDNKYYLFWFFFKKPLNFLVFSFPEILIILMISVSNVPSYFSFLCMILLIIKIGLLKKYVSDIEFCYKYLRFYILEMKFKQKIEEIINTERKLLAMIFKLY